MRISRPRRASRGSPCVWSPGAGARGGRGLRDVRRPEHFRHRAEQARRHRLPRDERVSSARALRPARLRGALPGERPDVCLSPARARRRELLVRTPRVRDPHGLQRSRQRLRPLLIDTFSHDEAAAGAHVIQKLSMRRKPVGRCYSVHDSNESLPGLDLAAQHEIPHGLESAPTGPFMRPSQPRCRKVMRSGLIALSVSGALLSFTAG